MDDKELLPCPFASDKDHRGEPHTEREYLNDGLGTDPLWNVRCSYCDASGPVAESEAEAIKAWNRRKGEQDG